MCCKIFSFGIIFLLSLHSIYVKSDIEEFKNLSNFIINGKTAIRGQFPGAVTNALKI